MRSPKDMKIIEIDITNVCIHECSNCTRFCGHHKKGYFMELDTVKQAIDSLEGFEGSIGLIGGEPTLHPDFEEIANYIGSKFPKHGETDLLYPQKNFMQTIQDYEMTHAKPYQKGEKMDSRIKGPMLLSVMGEKYAQHYETIQDNFAYQLLNDHGNEMYHDPILVSRKELKIPDEEWEVLRDACWIQNEWSASITPKGAFFCEVAGTLDMLFDGPGGWEVTKDWWKRDVADFKDQLHWCEICGAACNTCTRDANEEIDDVSPMLYEKLKEIGSKKLANGRVNLMKIDENGVIAEESKGSDKRFGAASPYYESYAAKFSMKESNLFPKAFEAVVYLDTALTAEQTKKYSERFLDQFQKTYFICKNEEDKNALDLPKSSQWIALDGTDQTTTETVLSLKERRVYTAVFSDGVLPKADFCKQLTTYIFNPGTLLFADDTKTNETLATWVETSVNGQFMLFNKGAISLRSIDVDTDKIKTLFDLKPLWKADKLIQIDEGVFPKTISNELRDGTRYAMYGTGKKACKDVNTIRENGGTIACVFDSDAKKHGTTFDEFTIDSPENIVKRSGEYDKIVIATGLYYSEIKKTLMDMGIAKDAIIYIL